MALISGFTRSGIKFEQGTKITHPTTSLQIVYRQEQHVTEKGGKMDQDDASELKMNRRSKPQNRARV